MNCLNSKIKCVKYHGTKNQYLHTCEKLKFQYGRQKLKYVYLNSKIKYKKGVDFYKFKVRESIPRSGKSLEMYIAKMAAKMAANTQKCCISQLTGLLQREISNRFR